MKKLSYSYPASQPWAPFTFVLLTCLCALLLSSVLFTQKAHAQARIPYQPSGSYEVRMDVAGVSGIAHDDVFVHFDNHYADVYETASDGSLVVDDSVDLNNPGQANPNPGYNIFTAGYQGVQNQAFVHIHDAGFLELTNYRYLLQVRTNSVFRNLEVDRWRGNTRLDDLIGIYVGQAYAAQATANNLFLIRSTGVGTIVVGLLVAAFAHSFPYASLPPLLIAVAAAVIIAGINASSSYYSQLNTLDGQYRALEDTYRQIEQVIGQNPVNADPEPTFSNVQERQI